MKNVKLIVIFALISGLHLMAATPETALITDPSRIDVYITPYYDPAGPVIDVGRFSAGLVAKNEQKFLTTINQMKGEWQKLTFAELYVAAIRLYDLGYRKEAVYWFYTANYRSCLFVAILDEAKQGSIGDSGFELRCAQGAIHELVGPYINGYAFGDTEFLIKVAERVRAEGLQSIPDLQAIYPGVAFKSKNEWESANNQNASGLSAFIKRIKDEKAEIKKARIKAGTEAIFQKLESKDLPSR